MVSLETVSDVMKEADSDPELGVIRKFLFGEGVSSIEESKYCYADIIYALNSGRASAFKQCLDGFESRKASETSAWCYDDSLIFLLLLGVKKFRVQTNLIADILKVRKSAVDTKDITQTFSDINENSFSVELPYDFLKIVLVWLANSERPTRESAYKCYRFLTDPGFFESLSPFSKLVALRSFELILYQREPQEYEVFEDLVVALARYKQNMNLRQLWLILMTLPYKWHMAVITALLVSGPWIVKNWGPIWQFWSDIFP